MLLQLLAIPSENPPADTGTIAQKISASLQSAGDFEIQLVTSKPPITNVVALLRGHASGRRLIFNGHLDTFEIGDESLWSTRPSGELKNGRVYGRGAADMKGGVAAQVFAARCLADFSEHWCGELVLTLTGDEQSGGDHGTAYLLENHPHAVGDAMMCADAGEEIMGTRPVATMRVGSSDAALYRFKGVPSVICGLTPTNMGGVDEYVDVSELEMLGQIYALSAFDFLANSADRG